MDGRMGWMGCTEWTYFFDSVRENADKSFDRRWAASQLTG